MSGEGKVIASGCAALVAVLAFWLAVISGLVWLVTSIVVHVAQ